MRDHASGSKQRMHCFDVAWWISCSSFRRRAMHSAIRRPKFDPIGAIDRRAVGSDLVLGSDLI